MIIYSFVDESGDGLPIYCTDPTISIAPGDDHSQWSRAMTYRAFGFEHVAVRLRGEWDTVRAMNVDDAIRALAEAEAGNE